MVHQLIAYKHSSQDKLRAIEIIYKNFQNVRKGIANNNYYTAPMLLITGLPGTGKRWLI